MERLELLKQLRIDRDTARATSSRARRLALAAGVVPALPSLAWFGATSRQPPAVRTAVARTASEPGAGSVLDASSYVTARRQATVSAKITGKLVEVLIEEEMRVEEGDVLARLDDTEAAAQLTAARSQLAEIRAQLEQASGTMPVSASSSRSNSSPSSRWTPPALSETC